MNADFWPHFLSQLLATVIAVCIGVPVGLWIYQRALTHRERGGGSGRNELAYAIDVLTLALEANRPRLQQLAQVTAQHQAMHETGLDASTWHAVQPFLASYTGNPAMRPRLAYHFSRVATLRALSDLLLHYTVGPESTSDGAPQVRRQIQADICSAATQLDREASELVMELRQVKSGLPAAK